MTTDSLAEHLADLIESNPECVFDIDNDAWHMRSTKQGQPSTDITNNELLEWDTGWYGNSSIYGHGIAEALLVLLNRRGFNIRAEAV